MPTDPRVELMETAMPWLPKKCVIVPVDFSDACKEAVRIGRQMVGAPEELHVVHVLPEMHAGEPGVIWERIDDGKRAENVRQALDEQMGDLVEGARIHVRFGRPGLAVVKLADDLGAELIVTSSHGRTGLARLALGSVAEKIVRLAHCPVLVLRR